ncbi:glycosyltransferase family 4 protein [Haladaptatus salinisoli]|uniref:glycosyltransferase family 4 protein n=1 Tax=Haladaptatus salinisoli TaxID=2884876 RepID=UPI001D0B7518|nr:glycosyltransferase family 4 protein [Haladaptatus salinisoli]
MSFDKDICMLFQGKHAHPAHRVFGDSVGAEYIHFETGDTPTTDKEGNYLCQDQHSIQARVRAGRSISEKYDVVIAEGTAPIQTLLVYATATNPDVKALYLAADETFYTLSERKSKYLWYGLKPVAYRLLDGCIAVGQDVYDWATPYLGNLPVGIVHPPIADSKYSSLAKLKPRSQQKDFVVLSAGSAQESKNQLMLATVTERLREKFGDHIRTVFLGNGHTEQPYATQPGIETPGFVPLAEFVDWFERASVYVQPSIGDSFPVGSLEGMLSGTPTVVTTSVGTRQFLPADQIAEPTVDSLTERLSFLYELGVEERVERGTAGRERVFGLRESTQQRHFHAAVSELIA